MNNFTREARKLRTLSQQGQRRLEKQIDQLVKFFEYADEIAKTTHGHTECDYCASVVAASEDKIEALKGRNKKEMDELVGQHLSEMQFIEQEMNHQVALKSYWQMMYENEVKKREEADNA